MRCLHKASQFCIQMDFCRAWNCTKVAFKIVWNYFFSWNIKSIDFDDLEIIVWILISSFLWKPVYCASGIPFNGTNFKWRIEAWIQLKKGASCRRNINWFFFCHHQWQSNWPALWIKIHLWTTQVVNKSYYPSISVHQYIEKFIICSSAFPIN